MLLQDEGPYLHLDIGGGSGDFALALEESGKKMGRSVEGHTVSASDLRAARSQVRDDRYHICNASQILTYQPIVSRLWNSIVCMTTMVYLEDNAKNLAEFHELLAPGGLLLVDAPEFLGIHEGLQEMVEFLNEVGYAVIAFYEEDDTRLHTISTIILQKTHPHLNFPITYDKERPHLQILGNEQALYAPDSRFMAIGNKEEREKQISFFKTNTIMEINRTPILKNVFPPQDKQLNEVYQNALNRQNVIRPR